MGIVTIMRSPVPETEIICAYMRRLTSYDIAMRRFRSRLQERASIEFDLLDVDVDRIRAGA